MTRYVNYRERGQSTLTTLLGMALGAFVIGGLMLFYFTASDNSHKSTSRADQEADAVKVLNRAGRDIADSAEVRTSREDMVVVEQRSVVVDQVNATKKQRTSYVGYAVIDDNDDGLGELMRYEGTSATFDPDKATVLARNVVVEDSDENDDDNRKVTKFEYKNASGQVVGESASDVGLVDITYVAKTKSGLVEISTSASVNTGIGGSAVPAGSSPTAEDVVISVPYRSSTSVTPTVAGVDGSPAFTVSPGALPNGISVSINATSGVLTASASSLYTGTVPSGDINAGVYSVAGVNGSAQARITLRVTPIQTTAAAPTVVAQCGSNNDTLTIPSAEGVEYRVNGAAVVAGQRPLSASATVTAHALNGYVLTNAGATWTLADDNVACPAEPAVMAYPEAAPTSRAQAVGVNVVKWSGGALSAPVLVSGPATPAPIPLAGSVSRFETSGTIRYEVPLGTVYRYQVGNVSDLGTQFPANQVLYAQGSDPDGDSVPEALGYNTIRLAPAATLPANGIQEVWEYKSRLAPDGTVEPDPSSLVVNTLPTTVGTAAQCAANTPGTSGCWRDTSEPRGSESVYLPVSYIPADDDYLQNPALAAGVVTKNGAPHFASYTRSMSVSETRAMYSDVNSRAYQAPSVAATNLVAGNPQASECWSADATPVRLVRAHAATPSNGLYSCNDGRAEMSFSAYADSAGRTANGGVNAAAASAAFCDYDGDPGDCHTRVVGGGTGSVKTKASTSDAPVASVAIRQSGWARSDVYSVTPCNAGGCYQSPVTQRVNSFAGKFEITGYSQPSSSRYKNYRSWYYSDCWTNAGCTDIYSNTVPQMRLNWGVASGISEAAGGTYTFSGSPISGVRATGRTLPTLNTGTTRNSGKVAVDSATLYRASVLADPAFDAASGVAGQMWRRSTSPSGAYWTNAYTAPLTNTFIQDAPFCRTAEDNGWRYGFHFRHSVRDETGATANSSGHKMRYMWWVGRRAAGAADDDGLIGTLAASRWRVASKTARDDGTWPAPGNWTNTTLSSRGTEFWANSGAIDSGSGTTDSLIGANDRVIPPQGTQGGGGVAHLRIETYVLRADAGNPDFGDLSYFTGNGAEFPDAYYGSDNGTGDLVGSGQSIAGVGNETRVRVSDATSAQVAACAGTDTGNFWAGNTSWKVVADGNSLSRRADKSLPSPYNISPKNGLWRSVL